MRLNPNTNHFSSPTDFYNAVFRAARAKPDPRLLAAAAGTLSSEGVGADGGYAVPPDYQRLINERLFGVGSLLTYCDQRPVKSSVGSFPNDEAPPWADSPGVQAYWVDEGASIDLSKPRLSVGTVKLRRLACLVPVSGEIDEDSDIGAFIERKAPAAIEYKIGAGIISGPGSARMQGITTAPATITVAAEGGQTADTINATNISKMWARMWVGGHARAIWIAHPDVASQFAALNANGTDVFTPGDANAPVGRIMGRPIILSEACEQLGDLGDILLADLGEYLLGMNSAGIKLATSIHVYFDADAVAFKFTLRVAGQPWWSAPQPSRVGGLTRSPFVLLGAR